MSRTRDANRCRFLAICEIAREQLAVAFHRGPTAGRIDDDRVVRLLLEAVDQRTRKAFGFFFTPGVQRERAAATLILGNVDFATLGGKDAQRRSVHVREEDTLHASCDESDVHAFGSACVDVRRQFFARCRRRSKIGKLLRAEPARDSRIPERLHQRLQSASNVELQRPAKKRQARRIREYRKHEVAEELIEERALRLRFDFRTRRFDQ